MEVRYREMPALHVVFDLDDTLYPERDYALGGFAAASRWARGHLGIDIDPARMSALLDDGHLGALFAIVLSEAKPDHTPEDLKGLVKAYGAHEPELALFDDAAAVLDALHGEYQLGLITDGHAATQEKKVRALGIAHRFRHIVYTGALGPDRQFHKPHPRAYEMAEAAFGGPGDRFVYIGDNRTKDFLAPNRLGWTSVEIERPEHARTRIHKPGLAPDGGAPHVVIGHMSELLPLLASLRTTYDAGPDSSQIGKL